MARILLVGTATLDGVFGVDHLPLADEEMRAHSFHLRRGGNAANSAVVLAGLGHQVAFLGPLADAPETTVIEQDLAAHGVSYAHCPRYAGRVPTSSVYLCGDSRSIVHYRNLPELAAEDFMRLDCSGWDWVHFEGRNVPQLLPMLAHMRRVQPDTRISLELEKPRPGIEAALGFSDLVLCSRGFALAHGFGAAAAFLRAMGGLAPAARWVVAWGDAGASALDPEGCLYEAPAITPPRVVDTLGAGDTFNAAMVDAQIRGWSLAAALHHACALSGAKCGRSGL